MEFNKRLSGDTLKAPISCTVLNNVFDTSLLYEAVKVPKGVPENEWTAQKVMDLFKDAQMAWGFVNNVCHCPLMRAHFMVFKWQEDPKKAALPLPATVYVKSLFLWVDSQIADTSIFPLKPGIPFSNEFQPIVKNLLRRLFRVYSHIYCHHWPHIESITAVSHVNYCLKHFVYTVSLNGLLEYNELKPLEELAKYIIEEGQNNEIRPQNYNVGSIENSELELNSNEQAEREINIEKSENEYLNEDTNKVKGERRKSKINIKGDINSPDTDIPSTNSLTADSPISEDKIDITSSRQSGEEARVSKNIKIQVSSYVNRINNIDTERLVQSTCSDSLIVTKKKVQSDSNIKETAVYSRKIKTYPWTELARKLILCTKRKKREGKDASSSGITTPTQVKFENI
ncbi:hypothetical protein FG386_003313 [Cryptosporidium ryanae]|uniref:uncharacterized protein n=1 Tax=Cryptosporidium ryanae TaxID=515981 RepID=UPI00351AA613|nr:hypothetical protein FG386_003313 [Cryptosporidium ryanae]